MKKIIDIQDSVDIVNIKFLELKFYIDYVVKDLEKQHMLSQNTTQAVYANLLSRNLSLLTSNLEDQINTLDKLVR